MNENNQPQQSVNRRRKSPPVVRNPFSVILDNSFKIMQELCVSIATLVFIALAVCNALDGEAFSALMYVICVGVLVVVKAILR